MRMLSATNTRVRLSPLIEMVTRAQSYGSLLPSSAEPPLSM